MNSKKRGLVALLIVSTFVGVCFAAKVTWYRREVVSGTMIWLLEKTGVVTQTGALKFGNDEDSPTIPTRGAAANYSLKVPLFNGSGSATAAGMVAISSSANAAAAYYGSAAAVNSTTTILGVWDGVYANNAMGWISVGGYALVYTTGTVQPGDQLVSTNTGVGYAAKDLLPQTTAACLVGIAVSSGNVAGGLTPVKLR